MKCIIASLVLIGSLTAIGQQPKPPAAPAAKLEAAKPAEAKPVSPEDLKALRDDLNLFQLDQLQVQNARKVVTQTDPVAKRAMEIINGAMDADPTVQKANTQMDSDRKALLDKIEALKKAQGLDNTWDWDFNTNRFVKVNPPQPTPAK